MLKKKISDILAEAAANPALSKEKRVEILKKYDDVALRVIIALAMDPRVKWLLPEEDPPYAPNELAHDQEGVLYAQCKKLYLFVEPCPLFREAAPVTSVEKRQQLWVQMLESVDREDAKLLTAIKHKKLPYKISRDCIEMAWPGITGRKVDEKAE